MFKYIDILKFIFSICVLCIHSCLFNNTLIYKWIDPLLLRLAVPFFFVASGFFLGQKIYTNSNFNGFDKWGGYLRRLVEKLLVFEPINIAIQILFFILAARSISYIIFIICRSVLFYPYGALWYIQALIVAILILIPFIKRGKECYALYLGIVLYCFALICNRYFFLVDGSVFEPIIRTYLHIFVSARNGLFVGLLYVSMGLLISKYWNIIKQKRKMGAICFALGYIGLIIEVYMLQGKVGIDDNALYLMMICAVPLLFIVAAQHNPSFPNETKTLRNLSTSIYLLHKPVLTLVSMSYKLIVGYSGSAYLLTMITLSVILVFSLIVYKHKVTPMYGWIR